MILAEAVVVWGVTVSLLGTGGKISPFAIDLLRRKGFDPDIAEHLPRSKHESREERSVGCMEIRKHRQRLSCKLC
jgi:hypothetical protein